MILFGLIFHELHTCHWVMKISQSVFKMCLQQLVSDLLACCNYFVIKFFMQDCNSQLSCWQLGCWTCCKTKTSYKFIQFVISLLTLKALQQVMNKPLTKLSTSKEQRVPVCYKMCVLCNICKYMSGRVVSADTNSSQRRVVVIYYL